MNGEQLVLYENISQCLTLSGVARKKGRHPVEEDLGVIENASCVVDSSAEAIKWIGRAGDLPAEYKNLANCFSAEGEVWLPELIDCHTHLIHAGNRSHDFALRAQGKSYQQVAEAGGGIQSTVSHTRKASLNELLERAHEELEKFQKYGIGVVEIKSGYGLNLESELKILECIQELQSQTSVILLPTFMPAHAVPPEFKGKVDDYVSAIRTEWISEVVRKKMAIFFDVFVEEGYFTAAQAKILAIAAKEKGLKIKMHCDQFKDIGGTALALELGAQSVDHLECISDKNIKLLGQSEVVAVLLPGASLFTGMPFAPARKLIDAGARVALSTDYNPGTCPSRNLPLMTTLACSQMRMSVSEAIAGITYNAAVALGLETKLGSLEPGKLFRVTHLNTESYEMLPYCFGELE